MSIAIQNIQIGGIPPAIPLQYGLSTLPNIHIHPVKRLSNTQFCMSQVFYTTLWLGIQPLVLVIRGFLFLFSQENKHMKALREDLEKIVLSNESCSTTELECLIHRYTNDPRYCHKDLKILFDILSIPELRPHIREILAGANVCFISSTPILTDVDLVTRWPMFKGMYQRLSSHNAKPGFCFGIDCGIIIDHVLVWVDQNHHVRFQLEKTGLHLSLSITNILKGIIHISNCFAYKSALRQQGPLGESDHIDTRPITYNYDHISYDHVAHERRRLHHLFENTTRYRKVG